jgi:hypothetical protein
MNTTAVTTAARMLPISVYQFNRRTGMKSFHHALTAKLPRRPLLYSSAAVLVFTVGSTWSAGAQDQPPSPQAQAKQQTQLRDTLEEGPDITVQQPPPTVTVKQPQPTVTVTQKPPRVTVQQPPPEIQINMPEPQVTIKQPQPDVQIRMPEPKVSIQQNKPEVSFNQAPPDVQFQATKPQVQIQEAKPKLQFEQAQQPLVTVKQSRPNVTVQRAQQQAQTLLGMTGDEVVGQQVVDSQGKEIGEVIDMVISKQNENVFAVVDVGGVAAGKAKGVLAPVEIIKLEQGNLTTNTSKQTLAKGPAYNEGQYQPIELDVPIGEFTSVTAK